MVHEFDGRKYEKASAHQREWGARLISELSLKGDEHILDLGCGDGANTARMAELVPRGRVVGIDASRGMIEVAKPKETDNLRFILMDINALEFVDEFDVVYSNATLHWVKDHRLLLKNAHRALRNDGVLRFNFAGDGNCAHFFKVVRNAMQSEPFRSCFADFSWPWYMPSIEEYSRLVGEGELRECRVWGENADRFFPTVEALVAWIDQPSLVPFLSFLPESRKAAFRDHVVEEMIDETRRDDGRCFETFRRINLFAKK